MTAAEGAVGHRGLRRWRIEGDRVIVEPEATRGYVEGRRRASLQRTAGADGAHGYVGPRTGCPAWARGAQLLAPQDAGPTLREGTSTTSRASRTLISTGPPPKVGG